MKRFIAVLLLLAMAIPMLTSCEDSSQDGSEATSGAVSQTESKEETPMIPDANAQTVWKNEYSDSANGIGSASDVYKLTAYLNGAVTDDYASLPTGDSRYIMEGKDKTRVAVLSEGYALTLPGTGIEGDFTLGALRSKFFNDDYMLTVTFENQNPYGATESGWQTYFDEWLVRYLDSNEFRMANTLSVTKKAEQKEVGVTERGRDGQPLNGFVVNTYNTKVNVSLDMEYDCYSIAVVRPAQHYRYFYLFVLKSKDPMGDEMDAIVESFKEISITGKPVNSVGSYELKIPEFWSEETKAYYNKLLNQTTVDFGAFYEKNDPAYVDWLASEEAIGSEFDIFMTYYHIGWYGKDYEKTPVDVNFLNSQAGGNGFDDKPVLEFTYQFTTTNNTLGEYTPMYDICRGRLDAQFVELARAMKAYGKPVLFRLNNEMNTDWTSYCGMQTLLDPDIFISTWRRLYDIFVEEGVDNCIWIWNPIATSCPYSNWGDQLNYWPGEDYVQMLGLTYYQMNNDANSFKSFKDMYQELYKKNTPWFDNYPAILGEFACGAGGEVKYNYDTKEYEPITSVDANRVRQAEWIKGMFECFLNNQEEGYEFCKNIKAAAWFSANDYVEVNGETKIMNYLKLDAGVPLALQAFREGYAELKARREAQ